MLRRVDRRRKATVAKARLELQPETKAAAYADDPPDQPLGIIADRLRQIARLCRKFLIFARLIAGV